MIPVFPHHLKDASTDTVALDGRLGDLFAHNYRNATVHPVLVLAILDQNETVSCRFAVSIQIAETAMAMEAVFLR